VVRILFVDDETRILDALQRMLRPQRSAWDMAFAAGAEAALTMLEAASFDVIVSDMRMPGMDGAALLEVVRTKYPGMLRIVLSGYTELEASFRAVPVAHQFLLKPCDADALRMAIERGTRLLQVLNSKMLVSIVGSLQELPSLPKAYSELRVELSNQEPSVSRIAKIVEDDVGISAKVLQLVNSAFFGLPRDVSNVTTAVTYLGTNILQHLVLSLEVLRTFQPKKATPGFSIEGFSRHSHMVAQIAARIPQKGALPGAVVVAGLLHDVGKLVIAERTPDHFVRALTGAKTEKRPLFEVEEELIGVSHAEVGAYLLSMWGLPYPVVEAVAHHHHPERIPHSQLDMITAVHLANTVAHECSDGLSEAGLVHPEIDPQLLATAGGPEVLAECRKVAILVANGSLETVK
jgi:putative nucleotidyltransferase with HDIG domain